MSQDRAASRQPSARTLQTNRDFVKVSSATSLLSQGAPLVDLFVPFFACSGTGCLLGSGPMPMRLREGKDLLKDMCAVGACAAKPRTEAETGFESHGPTPTHKLGQRVVGGETSIGPHTTSAPTRS